MSKPLQQLPGSMRVRGEWARKEAIIHPENVQVDDNNLAWIFNDCDKKWYSFDGNYSSFSPEEKIIKELAYQEKMKELSKKYEMQEIERLAKQRYWSAVRKDVLERDGYTCQLCGKSGKTKLHIHHIMKIRDGGSDHIDNLLTVCPSCHKKADGKLYNPQWI